MRKLFVTLVAVAVAIGFAFAASAEKTKIKGTEETATETTKFKLLNIDNGKFTTEKGKVIKVSNPNIDPTMGVRVEELKMKAYHSDTPAPGNDYVTFIKDQKEVIRPIQKDAKVDHLKTASTKKIKVYSTYNIMDAGWQVLHAEVLE